VTILFLCSANMHRSPLAAALLQRQAALDRRDDLTVASAGTAALPGAPVVAEAITLASQEGMDLSDHRARAAAESDLETADLIVVMESDHRAWVAAQAPNAAGRCRLLSEYAPPGADIAAGDDVPDAVGEGMAAFARTLRILKACVRGLYEQLPPAPEVTYAGAIEERLARVSGRAMSLTPADWQLLDGWWRRDVPLWLILEEIDAIGRRRRPSGTAARIRRLAACRDAVETRFEALGRSRFTEAHSVTETQHCDAAGALRQAALRARGQGRLHAADLIDAIAARLVEIAPAAASADPATYSLKLLELERTLLAGLVTASDPGLVARCREEALEELQPRRGRMTDAAWETTLQALLLEKLRREHALPAIAG
jgi:protein-tyrosine-phosphatase